MSKSESKQSQLHNEATKSTMREALPQILAVAVKNVLLLGFGMTLGFPTILIPSLQGNNGNEKISLGPEAISWIGSINLICVPIGCLLSGAITQPIGRKRAMQLVNIPFLAAWLLFHFSTEVWQIFVALALTGLSGGLLEAPTLTYVAEITTPNLRGILGSTSSVSVITGTLIQFLLGTFFPFRTVALISCINPIISFILYFFVPESPHWMIYKNRLEEGKKSLAWLRGWKTLDDVDGEFQTLVTQLKPQENVDKKQGKFEALKLFSKMNFLNPFCLISFCFFLGFFSGQLALQTYAVKIFTTLRSPIDKYYATIFLGCAQLSGCMVSVTLINTLGKRKLNLFSLAGLMCCFALVGTFAYLLNITNFDMPQQELVSNSSFVKTLETQSWIPTVCLISGAFFCNMGIRILPWMLMGEVFPPDIRAMASGMAGAVSYLLSFMANKTFLTVVGTLTLPGTFWFFGCIALLGIIVLYFWLPETEGKTLYAITEHYKGNSKLGKKVLRHKKDKSTVNGHVNEAFKPDKYEQCESRF